uniref:Uncharacterized protein n=1 Tax=Plectus sambesii TaxID=2011161 RepID=A0A914WYE6_9BILA
MAAFVTTTNGVLFLRLIVLALLVFGVHSRSGRSSRVRQCSCHEQSLCVKDLEKMGERCLDKCWSHTRAITSRPNELRQCFRGKTRMVKDFEKCAQKNMKSCVQSRHGPKIPKQSISGIMRAAERKVHSMTQKALSSGFGGNMNRLISSTQSLGDCVKNCIIAKTADGVCLRKYRCQPLLPQESKAGKLISKCMRIDIKKEGGPLCNCALKAGVRDLSKVCSVLSLMGSKSG